MHFLLLFQIKGRVSVSATWTVVAGHESPVQQMSGKTERSNRRVVSNQKDVAAFNETDGKKTTNDASPRKGGWDSPNVQLCACFWFCGTRRG